MWKMYLSPLKNLAPSLTRESTLLNFWNLAPWAIFFVFSPLFLLILWSLELVSSLQIELKRNWKFFGLVSTNIWTIFCHCCNAEETIKSNVNNNVTDFEVNGFTKQRYSRNGFLTKVIFNGTNGWKVLKKYCFVEFKLLTTYFKKILSCCKIYCVEKKKCLEKFVKVFLLTKEQKHSKTSFSVREDLSKPKAYLGSLPPAIEVKGVVSMKLSEKNTTYHFTHISFMKGSHLYVTQLWKRKI